MKKKIAPDDEAQLLLLINGERWGLVADAALDVLTAGVATAASLPTLKRLCEHPPEPHLSGPIGTIETLCGASERAFYRSLLEIPRCPMKPFLFSGPLWRWGDESDVPRAARLLKRTYARQPRVPYEGWETPATAILRFLMQWPEHPDVQAAFEWVLLHRDPLTVTDRKTVPRVVPMLRELGCGSWVVLVGRPGLATLRLYNHLFRETKRGVLPVDLWHPRAGRARRHHP